MLRSRRVGGKTRLLLWLVISVSLFAGVSVGTAGAYHAGTYNSAEWTILVGIDARETVDPRMTPTGARLTKAAFLVRVLNETSDEIRWERNRSARVVEHADQAVTVVRDVNRLLTRARAAGLSESQAARADELRERLDVAVGGISTAIDTVIARGNVTGRDAGRLREARERMVAAANATNTRVAGGASNEVVPGDDRWAAFARGASAGAPGSAYQSDDASADRNSG